MGDSRINPVHVLLFVLAILVGGFYSVIFKEPVVKAAQPISAKVAYSIDHTTVYCEQPSGDKIYVTTYGTTSGVAVSTWVVPGGCK